MKSDEWKYCAVPSKPKQQQVRVETPEIGFSKVFYVNETSVTKYEEHFLLRFFLTEKGENTLIASCLLDATLVLRSRPDWAQYLNKMCRSAGEMLEILQSESHPEPTSGRFFGRAESGYQFANICRFAYQDNLAETRLYAYSIGAGLDAGKEKKDLIQAQPVFWFYSPLHVQALLISTLYEST